MLTHKANHTEAATTQSVEAQPEPGIIESSCRILVIEDNPDANSTLTDFLTLEGYTVASAFDGLTGVAMAADSNYDVVLCDIGLPGLSGYEVARRVKLASSQRAPCCIAMTGYAQKEQIERAFEAGFDFYLVKPVAINDLLELISKNCQRPTSI